MKIKKLLTASLLLILGQTVWAAQSGQTYRDPYEGYNRVMFKFNDNLDHYVMTPVAKGYRKVTPAPVRTGVNNFFNNIRDVVSMGSNLLRLDIKRASTDFVRVGINSTFGLGGLINFAGAAHIPDNKNTLGDTFASWGWKNSNYFVYPLLGPSTIRDSLGQSINYVYPVQNALFKDNTVRWSTAGLNGLSQREALLDLNDSFNDAAVDRYTYMRDIYMSMRNKQVGGTLYQTDEDEDIDDLVPVNEDTTATQSTSSEHEDINSQHSMTAEQTNVTYNSTMQTMPQTISDSINWIDNSSLTADAQISAEYLNYWHIH